MYRGHPFVFLEGQVDHDVSVVEHTRCRYVLGRYAHDEVWLAELPGSLVGIDERFYQRVGTGSTRTAGIDPMDECLQMFVVEITGVGEMADLGVHLGRWHAFGHQDLTHHGRPSSNLRVAVHREGADSAFGMALNAVFPDDRRHISRIVRRVFGVIFALWKLQRASGRARLSILSILVLRRFL